MLIVMIKRTLNKMQWQPQRLTAKFRAFGLADKVSMIRNSGMLKKESNAERASVEPELPLIMLV